MFCCRNKYKWQLINKTNYILLTKVVNLKQVFVWMALCKIEVNHIVVILDMAFDGCPLFGYRFDWLPEQVDTLTRVHVPIDEVI